MSTVISSKALGRALASAGSTLSPDEFWAILEDAVSSTDTLTGPERDFLRQHAGLDHDPFDPGRMATAQKRVAVESARADRDATADGYTTTEVAELLGVASAGIRRRLAQGSLYSSGLRRGREHVSPAWQFAHGGPLPHLADVISALPDDMHPLDVATFMATPQDELDDRTAAQWLASGGSVAPVSALADGLARV